MPLDPSIPLSVKTIQMPSAAESLARAASLKSLGQQQQIQQQQIQQNDAALAEAKRQTVGRDTLSKLIQANTKSDDKGKLTVDHQAIATGMGSAGFPDLAEAWLKTAAANSESLDKLAESKRQHNAAHAAAFGDLAYRANSAAEMTSSIAQAAMFGLLDDQDAQVVESELEQAGPDGWKALKDKYQQFSPAWQESQKPTKLGRGEVIKVGGKTVAEGLPDKKHYEQKSMLVDNKPAPINYDPDTGNSYLEGSTEPIAQDRIKPIPSAASLQITTGALSEAAIDQAAKRYLDTGVLPPRAAGQVAIRQVMDRAAAMDPTAALSRNAAVYKADQANLTNLQRTEGTLSAFEKTASKNLDQFLTLADKIPDTGLPWLNTPVRQLDEKAVGSANMAAINAARDVALREIARVTNDPKLSGALTDTARREVAGLIPTDATLPQIKAVAKVLKTDMANVHKGINEEIARVEEGIGGNPSKGEPVVETWVRDPTTHKLVKQ